MPVGCHILTSAAVLTAMASTYIVQPQHGLHLCSGRAEAGDSPAQLSCLAGLVCLWAGKVWPLLLSLSQSSNFFGDSGGFIGNYGDSEYLGVFLP